MLPYFHRFSVCMRTGENDWNTLREDAYFKKNIRIRVDVRGLNIYLLPINFSQVFLSVEYTAVVGAEILKEKEAT